MCVNVSVLFFHQNFEEFPEHRTHFFYLLQAVNSHCFPAFLAIPPAQFKLVLDSIIWAFKHTMRNVADTGKQTGGGAGGAGAEGAERRAGG